MDKFFKKLLDSFEILSDFVHNRLVSKISTNQDYGNISNFRQNVELNKLIIILFFVSLAIKRTIHFRNFMLIFIQNLSE